MLNCSSYIMVFNKSQSNLMSQIINFTDPIGRKDYFKGILVRMLIIGLISLFISDFNEERIFELIESYQFQFFATIISLDLDIRRVKDIGISRNWLYSYIVLCLLPSPYVSTGSIASILDGLIVLYTLIFSIYLIFKRGSKF